MTTEQRLVRLEQRNRWLMTGIAALLMAVLLIAQGKAKPKELVVDTLRAKDIWLRGEGKLLLHLDAEGITGSDAKGEMWLRISGTGLTIAGPGDAYADISVGGEIAAILASNGNESASLLANPAETGLSIVDKSAVRLSLVRDDDETTSLVLYDTKGDKRVELGDQTTDGHSLSIYDGKGKPVARVPRDG